MIVQHNPHRKTGVISGDMVGQAVTVILIIYKKSVTLPKGIRSHKQKKNRQHKNKKNKKTNNGIKNTKQKTEQQQCHKKQV